MLSNAVLCDAIWWNSVSCNPPKMYLYTLAFGGKITKQFKDVKRGCGLMMSAGFVPGLVKNELGSWRFRVHALIKQRFDTGWPYLSSELCRHHSPPSHTTDPPAQQLPLGCGWSAWAPACSMCWFLDHTWMDESRRCIDLFQADIDVALYDVSFLHWQKHFDHLQFNDHTGHSGAVPLHCIHGSNAVVSSNHVEVSIHCHETGSAAGAVQGCYICAPAVRVWVVPATAVVEEEEESVDLKSSEDKKAAQLELKWRRQKH